MNKQEMKEFIKKRIKFHNRHFNRYRKEIQTEINKIHGNRVPKSVYLQMLYSDKKSYEELAVIDELEYIIKQMQKGEKE